MARGHDRGLALGFIPALGLALGFVLAPCFVLAPGGAALAGPGFGPGFGPGLGLERLRVYPPPVRVRPVAAIGGRLFVLQRRFWDPRLAALCPCRVCRWPADP